LINKFVAISLVIGLLSLLAGWEIGRQIGGKWLGLATFFVLSSSITLAQIQISVYQRNLLPSLTLFILMCAIWTWNCPSFRRYILLISVFTFSVFMHYGILTLAPALALVSLRVLHKNPLPMMRKVGIMTLLAILAYTAWAVTTESSLINLLTYTKYTTSETLGLAESAATHLAVLYDFLLRSYWYSALNYAMTVVWMIAITVAAIMTVRKKQTGSLQVFFLFLGTYGLIHLIFFNSRLFTYGYDYMIHYLPLVLMVPAIALWMVLKKFSTVVVLLGLEILCVIFLAAEFPMIYRLSDASIFRQEFQTASEISAFVEHDFRALHAKSPYTAFTLTDYTGWAEPGWFSPAYLTYFEERDGLAYTTLRQDGNNLVSTFGQGADVLYLICNKWQKDRKWLTSVEENKALCVQPFLEQYLPKYLHESADKVNVDVVMTSDQNLLDANIFRISKRLP
jgi:hypothetical protein